MQKTGVRSLGWEDTLEKEMATHSSILAWRLSWTEEPAGLQSTGSQGWTRLSDFTFFLSYKIKRAIIRTAITSNQIKKQNIIDPPEDHSLASLQAYPPKVNYPDC